MSYKFRYVAAAALAAVLAAGAAACGSDSEPQLRSQVAAGSDSHLDMAAGERARADRIEAAAAPGVAEVYGADRSLQIQADLAAREALVADAAGADQHLEILAAELEAQAAARQALIEDASGSDRHLENLADQLEKEAARLPVSRIYHS